MLYGVKQLLLCLKPPDDGMSVAPVKATASMGRVAAAAAGLKIREVMPSSGSLSAALLLRAPLHSLACLWMEFHLPRFSLVTTGYDKLFKVTRLEVAEDDDDESDGSGVGGGGGGAMMPSSPKRPSLGSFSTSDFDSSANSALGSKANAAPPPKRVGPKIIIRTTLTIDVPRRGMPRGRRW